MRSVFYGLKNGPFNQLTAYGLPFDVFFAFDNFQTEITQSSHSSRIDTAEALSASSTTARWLKVTVGEPVGRKSAVSSPAGGDDTPHDENSGANDADSHQTGETNSLKALFDSLFDGGVVHESGETEHSDMEFASPSAGERTEGSGSDQPEAPGSETVAETAAFEAFAPAETEGGAILHDLAVCPCPACGARDEAVFKLEAGSGDSGTSGTSSSAAPLADLADYLISGYWDDAGWTSTRSDGSWSHNLGSSGSDPNNGVLYYNISGFSSDSNGLSSARKVLVREVFKLYEATLGIQFVETTSTNTSVVDFFFSDNDSGAYAYSSSYTNGSIAVSYINVASSWSGGTSTYNDYTLQTIFHEVGHALGLGHQGFYNGTATYGVSNTFANDSWQASMMSYFSQTENTTVNASGVYLQTPMTVDWMALDALYSPKGYGVANAFTEDTTWGFNTTVTSDVSDIWAQWSTYANKTASTIVDGGGIDTLDLSGYSNNTLINLAPTDRLSGTPSTSNIGGKVGNLTIAEGTIIENAIGGAGSETFYGNSADNILVGNGGNDTFHDSEGADTYFGGSGTDTVYFDGVFADYTFAVAGSFLQVIRAAVDLVETTVEWLGFSDQTLSYQYVVDYVATPPNEAPVAQNDTGTVDEDVLLTGLDVLANDSDPENDALSIVAIDGSSVSSGQTVVLASGASVTLNDDGTLNYDQNGVFDALAVGETAAETFSYSVSDGTTTSNATVTLTINGAYDNYGPVATNDSYSLLETGTVSGNLLGNDSDPENDALMLVAVDGTPASVGSQIVLASGALLTVNADGTFDYDANRAFFRLESGETAADSFTYRITDGQGNYDSAIVNLTVHGETPPYDDKPVLIDFESFAAGSFYGQNNLLFDGLDITSARHLSGELSGYARSFTITAAGEDFDLDGLKIQKASGKNPRVWIDAYDNGVLVGSKVVTMKSGGVYSLTLDDRFDSVDQVVVRGQTSFYVDDIAVVTHTDASIDANAAPEAADDSFTTPAIGAVSGNLLDNDSDADGDALSVVSVAGQAAGTVKLASGALVTFAGDGSFTYDANGAFDDLYEGAGASDSFVYEVSDGKGGTGMATAVVSLTGTGTLAQIDFEGFAAGTFAGQHGLSFDGVQISATGRVSGAMEGYSKGFSITTDYADFNLDGLSIRKASGSQARVWFDAYDDGVLIGTYYLLMRSSGTYTLTFDDRFDSVDQVVVRAQGSFYLDDIKVGIGVDGTLDDNQSPSASGDAFTTPAIGAVSGNLLDNDSDADGDALSVVSVAGQAAGTVKLASGALVTFAGDGSFSYDANGAFDDLYEGAGASDSFVYEVSDGKGGTGMATAVVSLTGTGTLAQIDFEGFAAGTFAGQHGLSFDGVQISATGRVSGAMEGYSKGFSITTDYADFNLDGLSIRKASGSQARVWFDAYDDGVLIGTYYLLMRSSGTYTLTFDDRFDSVDQVVVRAQGSFYLDDIKVGIGVDGTLDDNQSPEAADDSFTTPAIGAVSGNLLDNDSDADGDALSVVSVAGQAAGTVKLASGALVTFAGDGSFTYDANGAFDEVYAGESTIDSFVYEVSDGRGGTDLATCEITINGTRHKYSIGFEDSTLGEAFIEEDSFVFSDAIVTNRSLGVAEGELAVQSEVKSLTFARVDGDSFDFEKAVFTAIGRDSATIVVEGYLDGELTGKQSFGVKGNREYAVWLNDTIFDTVDEVVIKGSRAFIIDDMDLII